MEQAVPSNDFDLQQLRRQKDVEIRRQLAQHLAAGTTGSVSSTMTTGADVYTDPLRWEAEKREIFQRLPMLACLTQDIPNPGDAIVFGHAGPSILVVRGADGVVNAFLNMCTHRASTLVDKCSQGNRKLTCPYHGWVFNLDGQLVGVPRQEGFDSDDLATRNLIRVPVGEWGGMIFVKAHQAQPGEERVDVEEFLGEIAMPLAALELDKAGPAATGRLDVACNWKYAYESFTEGYHVDILHSKSVGAVFVGGINGVVHYGLHHEFTFATQQLPGALKVFAPEAPELEGSTARIIHIFPNIIINFFPISATERLVNIHRVFPGKTIGEAYSVQTSYKFGGAVTDEDRVKYVQNHDWIVQVVSTEDFRICGNSYVNLLYAPKDFRPIFGRNEPVTQITHKNHAIAAGMPITAI